MQQLIKRSGRFLHALPVYVLIFILFWFNAGSLLWTGVRQICYHYTRAHSEEANTRDTIKIGAAQIKGSADLVWVKQKECRYKGRMFDVKKQVTQGDEIILVGHYDGHDDKLFNILFSYLDDENDTPANENGFPFHWISDAIITLPECVRPLFIDEPDAKLIPPELFFSSFKLPVLSEPPDTSTV